MAKNLLIVSHSFPPTAGIGGRRWAKFAKYLKRMGYNITVISAEQVTTNESAWTKDVEGMDVIRLPYNFPRSVAFPKSDILSKFAYYFNLYLLRLRDNGNYFDRSVFWEDQIQAKLSELIPAKKIDCVVVTSGPFRISNYVVKLKSKFPQTKFIVDFRDLWTEDIEITAFSALSYKRKIAEKKLEFETVRSADKVITVANELNDYFSSLSIATKSVVIPNGFDPEDMADVQPQKETSDKIRFVFTGTLYINLDYILQPFFKGLAQLKQTDPELFNKLEFEFIGRFPDEYRNNLSIFGIESVFKLSNTMPLKEVYNKIANAHYCLLFLNDIYNFALSTKFCEYISQKKKIIVISNKGPAAEFIENNKLGYWIDPVNVHMNIRNIILGTVHHQTHVWDSLFDVETFSIPRLTQQLSEVIEEPLPVYSKENRRHILLTFDYELYLGKQSGSLKNCILKPTSLLLEVLKKNNFTKAIFFVDTTYIKRLVETDSGDCRADLFLLKKQMLEILKSGHYLFPHLHPHWKDAIYDPKINQWRLASTENYRLHVLSEQERDELFSFSINFLKQLMLEAGVSYPLDSYRAGGWCLQPFSVLKPHFEKYGLRNDFSVLRGFKMPGKNIFYDFSHMPFRNIYRFSENVEDHDPKGKFTEIVISTLNISNRNRFLNKFLHKYLWYTNRRSFGDGYSAVDGETYFIKKIQNFDLETLNIKEMVSVELMTFFTKSAYRNYLEFNDFMHFISHPKMLSEHNLHVLDKFLQHAKRKYELNTDFRTITN